ncbi:uncharacterized protein [Epargyreus clarus]|uniref:uncharacterized protein isoform X2 n=1 Tax=Epargyreus clarus TaxID=520877 RepID=UPI003C309CD6
MATKGETVKTEVRKEVKVVQKQVNVTENQNGDANVEAAITVKLPVKKSAAKTETKVEIENKILPDGTVEETKTTTTKTTIDGKTEISTKTETRILSKEEADAVIEVEEEEEEVEVTGEGDEENEERVVIETVETSSNRKESDKKETDAGVKVEEPEQEKAKENGHDDVIIKQEERQEITTTKKVVLVQSDEEEEEVVEEEEEEEAEEVEVKKETQKEETVEEQVNVKEYNVQEAKEVQVEEQQVEEEDEEVEQEEIKTETKNETKKDEKNEEEEEEEEEVEVEVKQESVEAKPVKEEEITKEQEEEEVEEEEEYEEAEEPEVKEEAKEKPDKKDEDDKKEVEETVQETETKSEEIPIKVVIETKETPKTEEPKEEIKISEEKPTPQPEQKTPFREPSIPLEKVIDVEIKPIGLGNDLFTKSHTEIITTTTDKPLGHSRQTEYNRIENIVTVNRTTKTLDQAYEQMIQPSIPPIKTYFAPSRDPVSVSPQPSRPYQPVYPPEQTERRHSLLLERISVERQMPPADIYQNQYNQTEDRQWSQEPQSEVLTVSNVKPSTITKNQQWYQQTKKENVQYNNVTPTISTTPSQQWNQPQLQSQPQFQSQPQPQYQSQPQPQYQSQPQPQYQSQPQPQYQSQPQPQYQAPQPQYQPPTPQPSYTENIVKDTYKTTSNYTQNLYPGYTPKPTNWTSTVDNQNYLQKDSSDTYQKSTHQYSSSYVPPPWEQDPRYVADTANQNYYQPPPTSTFTPTNTAPKPDWQPTPPVGKFTKPKPTSYIPPAPNQSFVKPVSLVEPPKLPGRKTYYSEYERRYITVPESTYIPTESKHQVQPDPSPKYYYDNNEPVETVEPQWRKELREFTEKTSQTTVQTETTVRPPWEEDPKYVKTEYTPTPTWSQTLKPRSWRERSFESEYVGSKEWPKTNTLGRGRPQSSYVKSGVNSPIPERTRGVSVDRYNPNSYQSPVPSEHPPAQTYTLNVQSQNYHNPSVPAYHARAAADTREQPVVYQQSRPHWSSESRATPIQSRSFKYLQWITGTED